MMCFIPQCALRGTPGVQAPSSIQDCKGEIALSRVPAPRALTQRIFAPRCMEVVRTDGKMSRLAYRQVIMQNGGWWGV